MLFSLNTQPKDDQCLRSPWQQHQQAVCAVGGRAALCHWVTILLSFHFNRCPTSRRKSLQSFVYLIKRLFFLSQDDGTLSATLRAITSRRWIMTNSQMNCTATAQSGARLRVWGILGGLETDIARWMQGLLA